ncbi:MAG: hypothetical protein IJE43_14170 [Alphaproteobacteria bacterium]|nr:hypothetical protein [Alphaproteobacteria bacterium]
MKKVLIINGMGGAGKDTFVNFLKEFIPTLHISIVDNVKQIAKELGWNEVKDEKGRKFLSDLKLAIDNYNNGNYKYVADIVKKFYENSALRQYELLCIDMREGNQINMAKKDFDAMTVFIDRNVPHISSNIADAGVYNYKYDYYIKNDGSLLDLRKSAHGFVKMLQQEEVKEKPNKANANKLSREEMLNKFLELVKEFEELFNSI